MYAYGSSENFYPNLRYKTEPWRGMIATYGGRRYLVIDKEGDDFILEGEDGDIARGQHFDWMPATPNNRLVAASRGEDSVFKKGNIVNGYRIGNLHNASGHWLVTVADTDTVFPLDELIGELDEVRWNKQAFEQKFSADPAEKDSKPLVCPSCGSHTLRMLGIKDNQTGEIVCLTCGKQFTQPVMRNPEAKVALTYPEDPNVQAQMIGLMQQLAQANEMGNREEVKRIQAEIEKILGYQNDQFATPATPGTGGSPFGGQIYSSKEANHEEEYMAYVAQMEAAGETPLPYEEFCRMQDLFREDPIWDRPKGPRIDDAPSGSMPFGPSSAPSRWVSNLQKHAPGKEHMKGVSPKRNRQYEHILESCKREHPDWSEDRCKELAARTVNKQRSEKGETKDSKTGAEKYQPGTRVQVTHPKHKGQRGTITEFKGKQEDIDEEKYAILLDSGDTLEELNESFFTKIKSAKVNENLPDSTQDLFLESMSVTAGPYDVPADPSEGIEMDLGIDPYYNNILNDPSLAGDEEEYEIAECPVCGGPGLLLGQLGNRVHYRCRNCGMDFSERGDEPVAEEPLPELMPEVGVDSGPMPGGPPTGRDTGVPFMGAAKEADDFGGKMPSRNLEEQEKHFEVNDDSYHPGEPDYPWDEPEEQKVACPNCGSSAKSLGVRGPVEQFACTNAECRMQFGWPSEPPAEHINNDPEDLFGDFEGKTAYTDVRGESLKPGSWYSLHHGDYPVPDVVRILNIEDSHVEAAIASDEDNTFPIHIKADDGYTFEPYEEAERTEVVAKSGWKLARRNFTSKEQRELIEENPEGKARNFDKLNLEGTHYEIKYDIVSGETDDLDIFFI